VEKDRSSISRFIGDQAGVLGEVLVTIANEKIKI
jgi:hypothetical protein